MLFSNNSTEKLKAAFEIYNVELCHSLPSDSELESITFSDEFKSKMQKLIKAEKNHYYRLISTVGKRVALIVLSVLIALTVTTFGVKALREAVIDFITETFKTHTKISVDAPQKSVFKKTAPLYIPEGYTIEDEDGDKASVYGITYSNDANEHIVYGQIICFSTGYNINTEGAECETVYINSFEGMTVSKNDYTTVVFADGTYYYEILARLPVNELIKMAKSIPIPQDEFVKTKPQYLPNGFTLNKEDYCEDVSCLFDYRNNEEGIIRIIQTVNDDTMTVNTEDAEVENIYINSLKGIKYKDNNGYNNVVFSDVNYYFSVGGNISMEEIIKIAESIPLN